MSNHQPKVAGHFACELDAKVEEMPDFEVTTFEKAKFPDEVLTYRDIVTAGRKIATGAAPGRDRQGRPVRRSDEEPSGIPLRLLRSLGHGCRGCSDRSPHQRLEAGLRAQGLQGKGDPLHERTDGERGRGHPGHSRPEGPRRGLQGGDGRPRDG